MRKTMRKKKSVKRKFMKQKKIRVKKGRKTLKTKKRGGGKIYTENGDFENLEEKHDNKEIFRKMIGNGEDGKTEMKISEILMENPHQNIVKIYKINYKEPKYIDMEMVDTDLSNISAEEIKEKMRNVKDYLQSLGIMYIDWKPDNIGIGEDGELKLFDFDVSGLLDPIHGNWIMPPLKYAAYKEAIKNGMKTPKEIDDYTFEQEL